MKLTCLNINCGWQGTDAGMLHAPNPFEPESEITGCPGCKDIHTLTEACDEPGCWRDASVGTPTPTGYRRTCFTHAPKP